MAKYKPPRLNEKKLFNPSQLPLCNHAASKDRTIRSQCESCKKKMAKKLSNPAALIAKGPWEGSVLETDRLNNMTVLKHPFGAVMKLYDKRPLG